MPTRAFLLGVLDRAVKTGLQALVLGLTTTTTVSPLNVFHGVGWKTVLGLTGSAMILSVLTSLASLPLGDAGTTSAIPGAR